MQPVIATSHFLRTDHISISIITMLSLFHLIKTKLNFSIYGFLFSLNLRISVQDIEMMTSFTSFLEPLGKAESPYISLLVFVCPHSIPFHGQGFELIVMKLDILQCLTNPKTNESNLVWIFRFCQTRYGYCILVLTYYVITDGFRRV